MISSQEYFARRLQNRKIRPALLAERYISNFQAQLVLLMMSDEKLQDIDDLYILQEKLMPSIRKAIKKEFGKDNPFRTIVQSRKEKEAMNRLQSVLTNIVNITPPWEKYPPLASLAKLYHLTTVDKKLVFFLFSESQFTIFERLHLDLYDTFLIASRLIHVREPSDVQHLLGNDQKLLKERIVINESSRLASDLPRLGHSVQSYLTSGSLEDLLSKIGERYKGNTFDLETFPIGEKDSATLLPLLKSEAPCQILFTGPPGTGKSSYAASLGNATGKKVFYMTVSENDRNEERRFALSLAVHRLNPQTDLLVVDEADSLLNESKSYYFEQNNISKSWLTGWLEKSHLKVVWIVNSHKHIHPAVKRRFHYSLEFNNMDDTQRLAMWKEITRQVSLGRSLQPEILASLAKDYTINSGSIKTCLDTWKRSAPPGSGPLPQRLKLLRHILERHQTFLVNGNQDKLAPVTSVYDLAFTETDIDLNSVQQSLERYSKARSQPDFHGNLNILCAGLPGTGKTEWVKYVADTLGKQLIVKRASDLLNPYVGMTEHNIADAFTEAARPNELLAHMDQFNGVLICATNNLNRMDPAVLRRFAWKIEFRPLPPEKLILLVQKQFPHTMFQPAHKAALGDLTGLTAGDVRAVWKKHQFLEVPNADTILSALEIEARYKKQLAPARVGF